MKIEITTNLHFSRQILNSFAQLVNPSITHSNITDLDSNLMNSLLTLATAWQVGCNHPCWSIGQLLMNINDRSPSERGLQVLQPA